MNEKKNRLRDELINIEPMNKNFQEKYEREIKTMFEEKISKGKKIWFCLELILYIAMGCTFGYAALVSAGHLPPIVRGTFALGLVFCLFRVVILFQIIRTGVFNKKKHANAMIGITWAFLLITCMAFMFLASSKDMDKSASNLLIGQSLFWLIIGVAFVIANRIDQSKLIIKEKLLEIEYRVAELAEKIQSNDKTS